MIASLFLSSVGCMAEHGADSEAAAGEAAEDEASAASSDRYDGRYGQPISLSLYHRGLDWVVGRDGILKYGESEGTPAKFIIEFVRTTPTTNTNPQYRDRRPGVVYLRDVFRLKEQGTGRYVRFEPSDRTFRVGGAGSPAEFLLINKYGGQINKVNTDRYCKNQYDSFEYLADVNNRNVDAEWPWGNYYGRCAMRKLFFVQGSGHKLVGLNWRDREKRVTIDGVSGYEQQQHVLP